VARSSSEQIANEEHDASHFDAYVMPGVRVAQKAIDQSKPGIKLTVIGVGGVSAGEEGAVVRDVSGNEVEVWDNNPEAKYGDTKYALIVLYDPGVREKIDAGSGETIIDPKQALMSIGHYSRLAHEPLINFCINLRK